METFKYKCVLQFLKGIKSVVELGMKNGSPLCAIQNQGAGVIQKLFHYTSFEVKFYLRHKARLISGGNRTNYEKEEV
jgi:hypothetical protein